MEQTLPQSPEHLPPRPQEHPQSLSQENPLQNSPTLLPSRASTTTAVPAAPVTQSPDQEQGEQRARANLNANRLTMEQALELFELMQARRSVDVEKAPTVEALHVEVAPTAGRAIVLHDLADCGGNCWEHGILHSSGTDLMGKQDGEVPEPGTRLFFSVWLLKGIRSLTDRPLPKTTLKGSRPKRRSKRIYHPWN